MKRSEMVKLLEDYWNTYTWDDCPTSEEIAEYSLQIIEKAGMSPPVEFGAHVEIELQYADEVTEKYCYWESENEEN